jgi:hypothetical protein
VLLWVRLTGKPWREIGYVRPRSWIGGLALGVVFGAAFKLVMKAAVMPLFGADPINQAYHSLAGNTAMLPVAVLSMLAAGFGEENPGARNAGTRGWLRVPALTFLRCSCRLWRLWSTLRAPFPALAVKV